MNRPLWLIQDFRKGGKRWWTSVYMPELFVNNNRQQQEQQNHTFTFTSIFFQTSAHSFVLLNLAAWSHCGRFVTYLQTFPSRTLHWTAYGKSKPHWKPLRLTGKSMLALPRLISDVSFCFSRILFLLCDYIKSWQAVTQDSLRQWDINVV